MAGNRIIIVGGGFAGICAARHLPRHLEVTLIDRKVDFLWKPNLHEVFSDIKSQKDLTISHAKLVKSYGHRFLNKSVAGVDRSSKAVKLDDGSQLAYDSLVIAGGLSQSHSGPPSAFVDGLDDSSIASRTAQEISHRLHLRKRTTVSVIGAGFTGIEVVGELLRRFRNDSNLRIQIIDSNAAPLSELPAAVSRSIRKLCKRLPVTFHLQERVSHFRADQLELESGDTLDSNINIWCGGNQLPEWIETIDIPTNPREGIAVNQYLQSIDDRSIFVAGDAAMLADPVPKQSSHAMDMGKLAAANVQRYLRSGHLKTYEPRKVPVLLSFGDLNTYLIYNNQVVSSPTLAALKESIFQSYMAYIASKMSITDQGLALTGRHLKSIRRLLLPELRWQRPWQIASRSRIILKS